MSKAVVEALTNFTITDKPEGSEFRRQGKFDTLILACKNLSNERSIELTPAEMKMMYGEYASFNAFKAGVNSRAKRMGVKLGFMERGGTVWVWKRT